MKLAQNDIRLLLVMTYFLFIFSKKCQIQNFESALLAKNSSFNAAL
jgi:hypothetical protein